MALPKLETVKYELVIPSTQETVEYRPYNVKEEKILLLAKESGDAKQMVKATRDLISACTFGKVDVKSLSLFDFEYIFLHLRARAVGEVSDLRIKCESCGVKNDVSVEVTSAAVVGDINRDMKMMVTDDVGIVLRWPSFKASESMAGRNYASPEFMVDVIVECIESIFDMEEVYPSEGQSHKELVEFVESLPSSCFQKIVEMLNNMPSVQLDVGFKCMSCGEANELKLQGLNNFF